MNSENNSHFFIVTPLLLEKSCYNELIFKLDKYFPNIDYSATITDGGIELVINHKIGLQLNYILKSPTRILYRLTDFKCRDFPKLYNKILKFNWSPYLIGNIPEIVITSKNSRLFDSRKIESAIQNGIEEFYKKMPTRKKYLDLYEKSKNNLNLTKIFVRIIDDHLTLSLDTTGERLHLRNQKILTGHAPIRENLAYILLSELLKISDKKEGISLFDPMCGSGTFLIEALSFHALNKREFAFHYFPIYLKNYLEYKIVEPTLISPFKKITGNDSDKEIISQTKSNIKSDDIELFNIDIFQAKVNDHFDFIIVNPPYGKRIGTKDEITQEYYLELINKIRTDYNPELFGIIIPLEFNIKNSDLKINFLNGGLEVCFYIYKK